MAQQQQGPLDFPRIKILSLGDATVGKSCLIKRFCEGRFVAKYIPTIGIDYGVKKADVAAQSKRFSDIVTGTYHNPNFSAGGVGGGAARGSNSSLNFSAVRVNFWDIAGGEESFEIRNEFYNATQGILLVFDVRNRKSFENLQRWWDEICQYVPLLSGSSSVSKRTSTTGTTAAGKAVMNAEGKTPVVMLLGNKCDDTPSEGGGGASRAVTEQEAQQWAEQHRCIGYMDVSASTDLHVQESFETLFFHVIG
ncbi:ras family protein-like protein [Strigomonas culicis]|nr:ras family protein-like protein [Strigomonas culicis]|eukprot:EPY33698.1 ras family protein-like protein [Strigomonas culicis]